MKQLCFSLQLFILLTLLSSKTKVLSIEIYVERNADINTVNGARVELICEVGDIRDPFR